LAPAISAYLGATVNVVDIAGTGSIKTQDTTYGAIPNGLTFGQLNAVGDAELAITGQAGLNFNPEHITFLGGTGSSPSVLISTTGSGGVSSFAALKAAPPVKELAQVGGSLTTLLNILNGVLGLHEDMTYGYANVGAVESGFARGDGPVTFTPLPYAASLIQGHQAVALAVTSKIPVGMDYRSLVDTAPTIAQLLAKYPPKTPALKKQYQALEALSLETGFPMIAPNRVPKDELAALEAAIKESFTVPTTKAALLFAGVGYTYLTPAQAKATYIKSVTLGKSCAAYLTE
jgi:hypothetical protein